MSPVAAETEFLGEVYEAAIQPGLWTRVLDRIAGLMDGASANLTFQDQITGAGRVITFGTDPGLFDSYFGYFATRNPLLRIRDYPLALRVMTDEDKLPRDELLRGEYYNDFLRRIDAHSIMIFRLAIENNNTTVLNVVRPLGREPFRTPDVERAKRLLPHLVRAFRVSARLSNMEERLGGLEEFVDRSASAVFVVDGAGRVLHANRKGEALIAARRGFALRKGILEAVNPHDSRRLATLIGTAGTNDRERRSSGHMALGGQGPRKPLSVTVTPARNGVGASFPSSCVLVSATDPEAAVAIPEQQLRELFGFTRAELRLALQLLDGHELRIAADNLGISYNTGRAHLGRMFAKAGAHRQTELIQIITRAL